AQSFVIIAAMVVLMILFTFYLAIKVNCPGSIGWLVGFVIAICGSYVFARLVPGVSKHKDDMAISMAVVNLFVCIGMIVLPFALWKFDFAATHLGMLIGGSLHSVGNVAGAGYAISNEVGEAAITIKLARVAMLSPGLILFNYLIHKDHAKNWKEHFHLPWYLW